MPKQAMRLLFFPREGYPTDRVRINVLFGRELVSRGHAIDLVMQAADERVRVGPHDWHGRTVWVGPVDSRPGVLHRLRKVGLDLAHDLRFLRTVDAARYDGVLVSDKFVTASLAALLARMRGVRFFFWLTFPYPETDIATARSGTAMFGRLAAIRGVLTRWLLRRVILPRSDHVFVQSERMRRDVCARGASPEKVSPILTGFDVDGIALAGPETERTDPNCVTLGYLGTLNAMRRLDVLVEMLATLRTGGMNARLLIVGDAPNPADRRMLELRAAELGVTACVEITGRLPQPDALRRLSKAHVCLSPIPRSPLLDVGSPTKLIEYLALGIPVVANDHPEQRAILRETKAGVCVPWGARHFARAVRWLVARTPDERAAMGRRGRAYVERERTYARIADDVERVWLDVIARGGLQPHRTPSSA
ncbi:MAG TPA: glycosyltransferase family 4 protein [Gammaproteobacteria bacterium]